jgi:hypothetical protein
MAAHPIADNIGIETNSSNIPAFHHSMDYLTADITPLGRNQSLVIWGRTLY